MAYQLTANEALHVQNLKNSGEYALAYQYIAERIDGAVQNGTVSRETQKWFEWAYHINGHDGSAADSYARTFTMMGASKDGITLTDAQFQDASNFIAEKVITDILNSGEVPTTPEHIILDDIRLGSERMGIDPEDFPGTLVANWIFGVNAIDALITNDALNK